MSIPTFGEQYAKLTEHLRYAQEDAAMLAHLCNSEGGAPGRVLAMGWLNVSEGLKKMIYGVTELAKSRLQ